MNRKGITPVVAIVLLMLVTVGGSYTVYEIYDSAQQQTETYQTDIGLPEDSLSIESCWGSPTEFNLLVRNTASSTINASTIPVSLNTTRLEIPENYTLQNPLVDPQRTYRITVEPDNPVDSDTRIRLVTGQETVTYRCLNLE